MASLELVARGKTVLLLLLLVLAVFAVSGRVSSLYQYLLCHACLGLNVDCANFGGIDRSSRTSSRLLAVLYVRH